VPPSAGSSGSLATTWKPPPGRAPRLELAADCRGPLPHPDEPAAAAACCRGRARAKTVILYPNGEVPDAVVKPAVAVAAPQVVPVPRDMQPPHATQRRARLPFLTWAAGLQEGKIRPGE
jgi:hypothetical protein